ncbi:MAG: NUDIX domain-containing protein [Candidatus Paceibacterota bacterium]
MEPLLKEKRHAVVFVPYRSVSGGHEFYLQKRDMNAPVHAGILSLFGGGIEGREVLLETLRREVYEELAYEPVSPAYFCVFETSRGIFHVFIEEVAAGFESRVTVQEGEYGVFLRLDAIANSPDVSDLAQMVVRALSEYLDA